MLKTIVKLVATITLVSAPFLSAKEIDLSNMSDPAGIFEIGLCARPSPDTTLNLPGHAFVVFTHIKHSGEVSLSSIGHTTDVGMISALNSFFGDPVSGYLGLEKYTSSMQRCLRVRVNKSDYERAFELTHAPLARLGLANNNDLVLRSYALSANDCITFMIEVADELKPLGLAVPARGAAEFPLDYMKRVIDSN